MLLIQNMLRLVTNNEQIGWLLIVEHNLNEQIKLLFDRRSVRQMLTLAKE